MERDLDQLAEQAEGYAGPVKVQAGGPLTLAASLELPIGGRLLRDPGAVRDLTGSLAEGLRGHVAAVARRLPGASVLLQLDEPSLPTVLAGRVPTESGLGAYRAVESTDAAALLRTVVDAVGVPTVVHCCAPQVPLELIRSTGAVAVALDLDLVTDLDPLGEAIDAGLGLLAGAAPTRPPSAGGAPTSAQVADRVRQIWDRLGFPRRQLAEQVVVTPACGLAGATPSTPGRCSRPAGTPAAGSPRSDVFLSYPVGRMTVMIGQLRSVVIDCPDPRALAAFYAELLGIPLVEAEGEADDEWVVLGGPPGHQPAWRSSGRSTCGRRPGRTRSARSSSTWT